MAIGTSRTRKSKPASRPSTLTSDEARALREERLRLTEEKRRRRFAAAASQSLRLFIAGPKGDGIGGAWQVVEPTTALVWGWHLDVLCAHLEAVTRGEILSLLVTIPPRCMKSLSTSVFWPAWVWTTEPGVRWLFSSYAHELSIRDSVACRTLIESTWYQEHWGDRFSLASDQNVKHRFQNSERGYRLATSVGGANTGEGADILAADDPHNVNEVHSDAAREADRRWWTQVMSTRLNDPKTGRRVIIMQRSHTDDLAALVLQEGGWTHLRLPMEYEPPACVTVLGTADRRTEPGELLWPERFGRREVDALKARLGSYGTAGQLQQHPSPAGGGEVKRHWFGFWYYPGQVLPTVTVQGEGGAMHAHPMKPLPQVFEEQLQSWDLKFKSKETSSFVAGGTWARLGADAFLLDQRREHLGFTGSIAAIREMTDRYPQARAKLVEDKANGPAVIEELQGKLPGLIAVEPDGDKIARARAVTPYIEATNVWLPHPLIAPWVEAYLGEWQAFPNSATFDQIDQTSQALRRLLSHAAKLGQAKATGNRLTVPREPVRESWRDDRQQTGWPRRVT